MWVPTRSLSDRHSVTVPAQRELRVGTVDAIVADVAGASMLGDRAAAVLVANWRFAYDSPPTDNRNAPDSG